MLEDFLQMCCLIRCSHSKIYIESVPQRRSNYLSNSLKDGKLLTKVFLVNEDKEKWKWLL